MAAKFRLTMHAVNGQPALTVTDDQHQPLLDIFVAEDGTLHGLLTSWMPAGRPGARPGVLPFCASLDDARCRQHLQGVIGALDFAQRPERFS